LTNIESDQGLWTWLSLFYFDELYPPAARVRRKPGERARWILNTSGRRYYRHLLAGPFLIYKSHRDNPDRAMVLLCGPLADPGEIVAQIASRQEIVTNRGLMEAAKMLYYDSSNRKPKRGAASKTKGAARRFADVMNQFDVTWDLYSLEAADVIRLLPDEFSRFCKAGSK
jgi:hypothetical protein